MSYDPDFCRTHALALLDFWRRHAVDRAFGGFRLHLDRRGNVYEEAGEKHLVGQTRAIYSFSQGVLLGGPAWCAETARHGVRFALDHLWDADHGGWFWSLNRDGSVRDTCKRTYGHDFAVLALTEFHRATGDEAARDWAERTFALMDEHLWEADVGAYCEGRNRTWGPIDPPWRGQNCNMHALETTLALHEITGEQHQIDRIVSLLRAMNVLFFDARHGCIHEDFHADWRLDRERRGDRLSIGHQFEWAWLLMRAEAVAPDAFDPAIIDRLMDFAVSHGWDETYGGVYTYATQEGEVTNDAKGYWENSEALMALLWYARRTGEQRYRDLFERCADFCFTHLADREAPGWFAQVARDGTIQNTAKGGSWKADYHIIQMCAEIHRFLR